MQLLYGSTVTQFLSTALTNFQSYCSATEQLHLKFPANQLKSISNQMLTCFKKEELSAGAAFRVLSHAYDMINCTLV